MSSAPFINFNRIHCPLGERLRSLRYRRQRQTIEQLDNDLKQLKKRRDRERLILDRFFVRPVK